MRRTSLAAILAVGLLFMAACSSSNGTTITVLGYTVTIKTAPPTTAQVGASIPIAFTVTENESDGSSKPASGKSFTVAVTAGGGTVNAAASATLTTAADGSVSLTWILGSTVGAQTVRGSVSSDKFLDVNVTATPAFVEISAGSEHSCGLTQTGAVYCWGNNAGGELGDGTTTQRLVPTLVSGSIAFVAISTGSFTSCGLTQTGAAYCWGNNNSGEVGDGTTTQRLVPTLVLSP
jgi:alpha-tubulin suppressor-like RCC1 family protein